MEAYRQWQIAVSDKAAEIQDAAIKKGAALSEGLRDWAMSRAMEQVPQPTMSDLMDDYLMDDYADDTCLNCGNHYNHDHNCSELF